MEIFNIYRHRFLRILLIVAGFQVAQLFSQRESWPEPYWEDSYQNRNGMYSDSRFQSDEDFFSSYRDPFPYAGIQPQNGQWPASSSNEWNDPYPSMLPRDGHWPATSSNAWDDPTAQYDYSPSYTNPSEYSSQYYELESPNRDFHETVQPQNLPNEWQPYTPSSVGATELFPNQEAIRDEYNQRSNEFDVQTGIETAHPEVYEAQWPSSLTNEWSNPSDACTSAESHFNSSDQIGAENPIEANFQNFSSFPDTSSQEHHWPHPLTSEWEDPSSASDAAATYFSYPPQTESLPASSPVDPWSNNDWNGWQPNENADDAQLSDLPYGSDSTSYEDDNFNQEEYLPQAGLQEESCSPDYPTAPFSHYEEPVYRIPESEQRNFTTFETPNNFTQRPRVLKEQENAAPPQEKNNEEEEQEEEESSQARDVFERETSSIERENRIAEIRHSFPQRDALKTVTEKESTPSVEIPQLLKDKSLEVISIELIAETISGMKKENEEAKAKYAPPAPQPIAAPNQPKAGSRIADPAGTNEIAQRQPTVITPTSPGPTGGPLNNQRTQKEISINFNNVAMIEYIRFISRISNKNFIFDDEDLQFNVTIVSEEPTSVENLMAALLQELRIRDLSLIEQGNNIIIHRNPRIRSPGRIVANGTDLLTTQDSELVTRVFRLNTLDPIKASEIIRPLLSEDALVEVLRDTNNLIITDLVTNVNKIAQLIRTLDAPNSGVTIGQYVVRNAFVASLIELGTKILQPIAQGNPFVLVPHPANNSIFIVSNSFIVEKALAILQNLDLNDGRTKILSLETLHPAYTREGRPVSSPGGVSVEEGTAGGGRIGRDRDTGVFGLGEEGGEGGGLGRGARGAGLFGEEGGLDELGRGGRGTGLFGEGAGAAIGRGARGTGLYGEGYGPGGQFPNRDGVPESYGFGGALRHEGVLAPQIGAPGLNYPFVPGGLGTEGRFSPTGEPLPPYPFVPGGIGSEGRPSAIFDNLEFMPGGIAAATRWSSELPIGHIERTLFFIHKLRFRRGDQIEIALRKIANSLQLMNTANIDLISAINSSQWIESSNALVFTGTAQALDKVRELILEVDTPLRQVFIEMLILNTTVADSLTYGVDWIDRFGGGNTTGEEGFIGLSNLNTIAEVLPDELPLATGIVGPTLGFNAAIIGTHLTHNGTRFNTIGALVRAIHTNAKTDILMNPKIVTEDNHTAEIFVGGTDRYKTQSITNELGTLVTNNFQFIDVGTTLRVTPLIGSNDIITLDIIQETTNGDASANATSANQLIVDVNLVPVLTKTRTITKVHVPNGFFVVLSGMIQDTEIRSTSRIPCLGGIPIIGAFGKTQNNVDDKKNLMIFLRPLIINNSDEYEDITRRQQDVFREKSKFRRSWNYEIDEALNFGNIKPTDRDEIGCYER